MAKLDVARLFGDPSLTGTLPTNVQISPDGQYATYLKVADDDRERLDLWRCHMETGVCECWLDGRSLASDGAPSAQEKAAKERKRLFSHGITDYRWSPDGTTILLPVDGAGYLMDAASLEVRQITPAGHRHTDIQLSPLGNFVSYVRNGSLYYTAAIGGTELLIAESTDPLLSFGIADFIAQEEMHRFKGHWWHPQEQAIALTKVDESTIEESRRFEAEADQLRVITQRYPFAGAANAKVELAIFDIATGATRWIDYRDASDDYLGRVDFAEDKLAIQVQDRSQRRVTLKLVALNDLSTEVLLVEQADAWINLHDNFRVLGDADYLWTSERDGYQHLYRYRNGTCEQLTEGIGRVNRVLHVSSDKVLIAGWFTTPTEQHLYEVDLTSGSVSQTTEAGWHEIDISDDGKHLIDRFSSLTNPGEVRVGPVHGAQRTLADGKISDGHPYLPYMRHHVTPELGTLRSSDGQTLHYRLTKPHAITSAGPLIVYVYGGPGAQRVRNEWSELLLQLFAQCGFGVLELDNRGSSNRDRQFEWALAHRLGDAEVEDQLVGAHYVAGLDWVDAGRIGVFGHSYGGFMTLKCMTKAADVFKAGVAVAPVCDWHLYDTHYTERYLGTPQDNPEAYESSSVFGDLEHLEGKLLLMHGMSDDNVLFTHTTLLMRALQKLNFPFELMTYPGSKHALQERDVSIHRFNLIVDFFERNL
ncbi:MAG: alpha/beta fold hydrolase [Gammaproteobacteria bacterium]|nr:alpha/beta fold hydrolase [Gammaproteobacteria bacterium]